jgi:hypothetical protein
MIYRRDTEVYKKRRGTGDGRWRLEMVRFAGTPDFRVDAIDPYSDRLSGGGLDTKPGKAPGF